MNSVVSIDDTVSEKETKKHFGSDHYSVASLHPKQIVKRIRGCGENYTAALEILYTTQPFLRPSLSQSNETVASRENSWLIKGIEYSGPFDSKPICGVMNLLSKHDQFSVAADLLERTIKQHHAGIIPTYYLNAVFKSMFGIMAIQEQKHKQNLHREILKYIYHDIPYHTNEAPTLDIYHTALSALGKCRQIDSILVLLNDLESRKGIEIQSTAMNDRLQYNLPAPDRMAYLTALTGSIRCKTSNQSIEIMERMIEQGMKLDKVVYNHVLSSLTNTKSDGRYEMAKKIWKEMERENICSDATYKSLIRLFSKENQWSDVAAAKDKLNLLSNIKGSRSVSLDIAGLPDLTDVNRSSDATTPGYLEDLGNLEKVDNVKKPWYKIGIVRTSRNVEVVFGIQTHRNPILNGLSLVFYTPSGEKLGFMLIRNTKESNPVKEDPDILLSSILGMFIDEKHRGEGLAKIFMAIWIQICMNSKAFPRSEKINKPLLSLVLSNFGFVPVSDSAIEIEIASVSGDEHVTNQSWKPLFSLYSRSPLNFGERELRIQKMIVTRTPPSPKGKVTAVRTIFEHPMTQKAQSGLPYIKEADELSLIVGSVWKIREWGSYPPFSDEGKKGGISFDIDYRLLQRVIFGYLF